MNKINIVDSIMGSGKTTASINKMNKDSNTKYIFITPYLKEVTRVLESCTNKKFVQPEHKGKGKLENLHYLLGENYNIASTHALFKNYNEYTLSLIQQGEYTLILDEVFDVIEIIPLTKSDLNTILKNHAHVEGDFLIWDDENYSGRFDDIKEMAESKNLIIYGGTALIWNFPIDIFKAFKEVYILTYLFESQIQKYYYDYYKLEYQYIGVDKINNQYVFVDSPVKHTLPLKDKVSIIDDEKLNHIGADYYSLSVSWFEKDNKKNRKRFLMNILKNNIYNVFTNKTKAKTKEILWTTFKDYKQYLSGKGYSKCFISFSTRATNEYRDRIYLAYCVNVFLNPIIKQFFQSKGINVLEEQYALSEMIQWIWRSAIREGNKIWIYVPSSRMRCLLIDWLDNLGG